MNPDRDLRAVLERFGVDREAVIAPFPGGHINASWRVQPDGGGAGFLLQRLNPLVFPDGQLVMGNVEAVTDHLLRAVRREGGGERAVLRLARAPDGRSAMQAGDGAWWRLLHFVDGARTLERVTVPREAESVGRGFGRFHRLLADYDGPPLAVTLPGFHDSAARLAALEQAAASDPAGRLSQVGPEFAALRQRAGYAGVLPALMARGALPPRIAHNDAKAGNLLLDAVTGEPLAVVDLDTVMPGTLLADVGDLIRSAGSTCLEDEPDPARVAADPVLVRAVLYGFAELAGDLLSPAERDHLGFAGLLLTWEQAVRFLADHLAGDVYYKVSRPGHNLARARVQLALLQSLEEMKVGEW